MDVEMLVVLMVGFILGTSLCETDKANSSSSITSSDNSIEPRYFNEGVEADMSEGLATTFEWLKTYGIYFAGALSDEMKLLDIGLPNSASNFTKDFTEGVLQLTHGYVEPPKEFQYDDSDVFICEKKKVFVGVNYTMPEIIFGYRYRYLYGMHKMLGNFVIRLSEQPASVVFQVAEPSYRKCNLLAHQITIFFTKLDARGKQNYGISFQAQEDNIYKTIANKEVAMKVINYLVQTTEIMETVRRAVYDAIMYKMKSIISVASESLWRNKNIKICQVLLDVLAENSK